MSFQGTQYIYSKGIKVLCTSRTKMSFQGKNTLFKGDKGLMSLWDQNVLSGHSIDNSKKIRVSCSTSAKMTSQFNIPGATE